MQIDKKGRTSRKRGNAEGKSVRCRLDLSPEVAAKLYWLAEINKVKFPDGIPDLVEKFHRGDLIFSPKKVGAPRGKGKSRVR